jgi:hypothetical protein
VFRLDLDDVAGTIPYPRPRAYPLFFLYPGSQLEIVADIRAQACLAAERARTAADRVEQMPGGPVRKGIWEKGARPGVAPSPTPTGWSTGTKPPPPLPGEGRTRR